MHCRLTAVVLLAYAIVLAINVQDGVADLLQDATTMKEKWVAWLMESNNASSAVQWTGVYQASMLSNGSWSDINYHDPNTEVWTTLEHLTRITFMALAYNTQDSEFYHNDSLESNIELAVKYWLTVNPINPNWYQNQFVVPTMFGQIGLLVFDVLPNSTTQEVLTTQMSKTGQCGGWTSANHVMCSNIHVLIGLVYNNASALSYGIENMFSVLVIEPGILEGIKQDGSFFQHGQQLYSGKYGNNVTQDILLMIYLTKNTSFYLTDAQLDVFAMHVLDGQQWMVAGPSFDYGVVGRAIARPWTIECTFPPFLVGDVGGARASEWKEFSVRLINNSAFPLWGHKHYWRADYSAHRAPGYIAYVKMFSNRTYNTECVNDEGKKSLHISDGSLQIYKTGQEFEFVFPSWNWELLPGTTIAVGSQPLECTEVKALGQSNFVGGVSDTYYGVSGMQFHSVFGGKLSLKKAWFFFPGVIVNLGTDIQFPLEQYPVVTTMNQCLVNGDVHVSSQTNALPPGNQTFTNEIWWVHHENIAYVFEQTNSVTVVNQPITGTWEAIGDFTGNVTKDVFAVYINHPQSPVVNGSYQYFVIPDIPFEDMPNVNQMIQPFTIVENSPSIQAVYENISALFEVFFWEAGSVSAGPGWTVSVDQPCALMMHNTGTTITLTVSDPTQTQDIVHVTVDVGLQGPCCGQVNSSQSIAKLPLPSGEYAGNSVACTCTIVA